MYFDTHVNLHGDAFVEDLDDVLRRATDRKVSRLITICDRLDHFDAIYTLATQHDNIWCSRGVHPHHAKDFQDLELGELKMFMDDPNVVAVGETGLDLHYGYSELSDQEVAFRTHLRAARDTQLPVIVHTRNADGQTGDILEQEYEAGSFPILMHCYTGGSDLAERALKLGAYFSVSGILSFKSAVDVREVISSIPTDRIILETDCPYLAPVPMRGRRNEPAFLPHVAQAYASLIGSTLAEVASMTTENALRLFRKVT